LALALPSIFCEGGEVMTVRSRIEQQPLLCVDWNTLPLMLDENEASRVTGVSVSFLRKSRCEGARKNKTPAPLFVRVGGRRYYRIVDLRAWVDALTPRQVI
jgi:hypothetical protein